MSDAVVIIALLAVVVLSPFASVVYANGADERYADGVLVGLSMAPIAPFVGEKVGMLFSFRDAQTGKYLTNIVNADVTIETFIIEGQKGGELLLEKKSIDVSTGSFNLDYEFTKEGLYEIHVAFKTPNGKERNVGYLKQIRVDSRPQPSRISPATLLVSIIVASVFSLAVGYGIARWQRKTHPKL